MHIIKHLNTVNKHRFMVFKHCVKAGIIRRGLLHDLSKYSPAEFVEGARFYLGFKSPTEREREVYGYSKAWMHHKGRNKHHFEYWTDYNPKTRRLEPVKMPIEYVKEMFCDRVAASKVYMAEKYNDSSALNYFVQGRAKTAMHPETAAVIEEWLTILSERGESAAFEVIRNTKSY